MLTCLRIRQLAVIDDVELDFAGGLTVLTGQTGAGKSVLIDALGLVLGGRARADRVRTGAPRLEVEALFDVPRRPGVAEQLAAFGLADDTGELVLRRVVTAAGRSRATVGGQLATVSQLAELTAGWVDISSQHQQQTLTDAATHLDFLDAYARLDGERDTIAAAYGELVTARRALDEARAQLAEREERLEWLRFQLAELERVSPRADEVAKLEAEHARLEHADELSRSAQEASYALCERDGAVAEVLARLERSLASLGPLEPRMAEWTEGLSRARVEVEEVGRELSMYADGLEAQPMRLEEVRLRLRELERLQRRFGSLDEALARWETLRAEQAQLEGLDDALSGQHGAVEACEAHALELGHRLSTVRRARAGELGEAITRELADLAMGEARVEVTVGSVTGSGVPVGQARLTQTGIDEVEFLIAPNRGESPRPLGRVASGGELSRALLALKRVLAGLEDDAVYVFDEVDTGVGGAVAEAIGEKLFEISRHHQVICITHQPQIAAWADQHWCVQKHVQGERTHTRVVPLDGDGRRAELARMLGGREVSEAAHDAADALLEQVGVRRAARSSAT